MQACCVLINKHIVFILDNAHKYFTVQILKSTLSGVNAILVMAWIITFNSFNHCATLN